MRERGKIREGSKNKLLQTDFNNTYLNSYNRYKQREATLRNYNSSTTIPAIDIPSNITYNLRKGNTNNFFFSAFTPRPSSQAVFHSRPGLVMLNTSASLVLYLDPTFPSYLFYLSTHSCYGQHSHPRPTFHTVFQPVRKVQHRVIVSAQTKV